MHGSDPSGYLAQVHALEAARAYKRSTLEALELRAGQQVLDVGCGAGEDALALARCVGATGLACGVDCDARLLAQAWRRAASDGVTNVAFELADAHALPFPDARFDAGRSDRVFQHLERPEAALFEILRVCKPDARLALSDPDWDTLVIDGADAGVTRRLVRFIGARLVRNGDIGRRLRGLLLDAGVAQVRVEPAVLLLTDLDTANVVWGIQSHLQRAVDAREVDTAEAASWWRDLAASAGRGRFFGALTGFIARGRKH